MKEYQSEKQKLPMYYQQIYDLMQQLSDMYSKRLGQKYFRIFKQLYSRVRFELSKERKEHYENTFEELNKHDAIETIDFRGFTSDFIDLKIADKSKALLQPVYQLQLDLYEDLENTNIFNYLKEKQEMDLM